MIKMHLFTKSDATNKGIMAYYVRFIYVDRKAMEYYLSHNPVSALKKMSRLRTSYYAAEYSDETKELMAMDIIDPGYLERTLKEQFDEIPRT